jgi:hypothetical protein
MTFCYYTGLGPMTPSIGDRKDGGPDDVWSAPIRADDRLLGFVCVPAGDSRTSVPPHVWRWPSVGVVTQRVADGEWPFVESRLTDRERAVSRRELMDLAVGYPAIPAADWLTKTWYESSLSDLMERFARECPGIGIPRFNTLPSAVLLEEKLITTALDFLACRQIWRLTAS